MLRRTVSRRLGAMRTSMPLLAVLRPTPVRRVFWDKPEFAHRSARQRPWWETFAIFAGLSLFAYLASVFYYFMNRVYHRYRPSGDDIYITRTIDAKLFSRPDLALAALRMALHHVTSNTQTPFGCPMVAPRYLLPEATELMDFVWTLHEEQPAFSIPDLWALIVTKGLARLGGPNVAPARGRDDPPNFLGKDDLLVVTPTLIPEDRRDVVNMKRVLASEGFSLPQIIALMGAMRTLGFHEAANFHTTHEVQPSVRRGKEGPVTDIFNLPDINDKCTLDPYVFDSQYFNLLIDYKWKPGWSLLPKSKGQQKFMCSEKDRARDVVYLDPFSDQTVDSEKRMLLAKEKAQQTIDMQEKRRSKDGETGLYGRSGEAQFIPGTEDSADPAKKLDEQFEVEKSGERPSPCEFVSMRPIDVMLLDDGLCYGWLYRYSDSEVEFYSEFSKVVETIINRGYNTNQLSSHRGMV